MEMLSPPRIPGALAPARIPPVLPPAPASICAEFGHDFRPRVRLGIPGVDDEGWRTCACDRTRRDHAAAPQDPAGGPGCGMVVRLCVRPRCEHAEEHHITDAQPDPVTALTVPRPPIRGTHHRFFRLPLCLAVGDEIPKGV